jgi:hypothetical protein
VRLTRGSFCVVHVQTIDLLAAARIAVFPDGQQLVVPPCFDDLPGRSLAFVGAMLSDHRLGRASLGLGRVAIAVAVRQALIDLVEDLVDYRYADVGEQPRGLPRLNRLHVVVASCHSGSIWNR